MTHQLSDHDKMLLADARQHQRDEARFAAQDNLDHSLACSVVVGRYRREPCLRRPRSRDHRKAFLRDRLNAWMRLAENPMRGYTRARALRNANSIQRMLS